MEVEAQYPPQAELGLLDLLVVVAENAKLLIVGPLLAGLAAVGVAFVLPQSYVSQAILLVPSPSSPSSLNAVQSAAVMLSPLVLDPLVAQHPKLKTVPIEEARRELAKQIKAAVDKKDGLLRLDVTAEHPEEAQTLANAVIDTWLKTTLPSAQDREELEKRLDYATKALASVTTVVEKLSVDGALSLSKPLTRGEAGTSLVGLGELQARYLNDVLTIPRALQGLSRDVVKQAPTLPMEPVSNKKALITVLSALSTGFVLLLFVFARQSWRNAVQDSQAAPKLARLRAALWTSKL